MITSLYPALPLPEPITGNEKGSFAHNTILYRLPDNARRVIAENDFSDRINSGIEAFIAEIPEQPLKSFTNNSAPDIPDWTDSLNRYSGKRWLEVPWFFAEQYFYRRIVDVTAYFEDGTNRGVDPYHNQKMLGLTTTVNEICHLAEILNPLHSKPVFQNLAIMLETALWGNQHDLSLWPLDDSGERQQSVKGMSRRLLIDHRPQLTKYLESVARPELRVDIVVDNAGFELVCDLYFVDFLIRSDVDISVVIHAKPFPTFVSDALVADILATIESLEQMQNASLQNFAARLSSYIKTSRLKLLDDFFWTSPDPFWELSKSLHDELSASDLVVVKGDMNYRRLLGDLHWPFDTRFEDIVSYFPVPLLALRTLKSEIACGMDEKQLEWLALKDPEWLTNGRNGVIQFFGGMR